ncbi:MAG TPA: ATP-dependent DNA helicase [Actinotalea sp.]|nr:ATP-dependent DNA helicase [Actinotalea sp.]
MSEQPEVPTVGALLDLAVTALGGTRRDGQHTMALAVADAVDRREHLLVQAGTGTGKSLGYLVPAVRHAVLHDQRVVVSTATLALQRQVITRDLPLVAAAVAPRLPRAPQIALLKGWHNYVCLQKVAGGYPADEPGTLFDAETPGSADHPAAGASGDLGRQVVAVRAWAAETTTGDRDDLVPGVSDRAWRQVSVTSMECVGPRCPMAEDCFPEQARARSREADVVVTNHAMLGIAAGGSPGVLPEHDLLVVDEAHELADRVTAQATVELSPPGIEQAARLARRHGGVPTGDLETAAQGLRQALLGVPEGRFRTLPTALVASVEAVRDAARALVSALKPESPAGGSVGPPEGGLKMATSAVLALFEVAERMTGDGASDGTDVLWCARDDRRDQGPRLLAAPLVVSGLVRTRLLAGRTAVLTSATLTLGGSFRPLALSAGLSVDEERGHDGVTPGDAVAAPSPPPPAGSPAPSVPQPWRGLDVGSPFDHARVGILYVARHLPAPGREPTTQAQLDEIAGLVEAAGGATLGLFSSRRAALAAAAAMRERLDVPVLCQGDDQLPTLVRQFAADRPTCLFGTLSLWQGVDVPGDACRLVLIDRIPFPRPDDPVSAARTDAVEAAGGNGFMAVSATRAALLLAQGAGRLIRTDTDRGVVAVLDPRLVTARYGTFLARSLPPFWRTTDPQVARDALRRLAEADLPLAGRNA